MYTLLKLFVLKTENTPLLYMPIQANMPKDSVNSLMNSNNSVIAKRTLFDIFRLPGHFNIKGISNT